ncbi:BspA family leucine-rich repeat surface protein [Anaerorhabdus sp.]|uniref:BspA family leucine-rich repeat surface protein n=1 Tax=Anaerorhabdus sp. TaxID=1872524 RepID=UPI002FC80C7D
MNRKFLKSKVRRYFSVLLTVCMSLSMFLPITPLSAEETPSDQTLLGFAVLEETIQKQYVHVGTPLKQLNLPTSLQARVEKVVETEEVSTNPLKDETLSLFDDSTVQSNADIETTMDSIIVDNVTWTSDPVYDGTVEGTTIFTAQLPQGYTLGSDVVVPQITVVVEPQQLSPIDNVIVLIDALPTLDEWTSMNDIDAQNIMIKVIECKNAFNVLSDEDKLLIDDTRKIKLNELIELADQLSTVMPMEIVPASGTSGSCAWTIDDQGTMTIGPTTEGSCTLDSYYVSSAESPRPWSSQYGSIKKVIVESGVKAAMNSSYLFSRLTNCTEMDLSGLDTSSVTSMDALFYECKNLSRINLSSFKTSEVTSMRSMFNSMEKLEELDLNSFDTSKVTNMDNMFSNSLVLKKITFGSFNTSSVITMRGMFYNCQGLIELDLKSFDTSNVTEMQSMFETCISLVKLNFGTNFKTNKVTRLEMMFSGCAKLQELDLRGFEIDNKADMYYMFRGCSALENLQLSDKFVTSNAINIYGMFLRCSKLKTLDLSHFDTTNVTNLSSMFSSCSSLKTLDLSNFDTSKVKTMKSMFEGCSSLSELNVTNFDLSAIELDYSNASGLTSMFEGCSSLESMDISKFNVTKITELTNAPFTNMFKNCSSLKELIVSATPWNVKSSVNMFGSYPAERSLKFVDASGNPLDETGLKTAIENYKVVEDGNTADHLWYGWMIYDARFQANVQILKDGVAYSGLTVGLDSDVDSKWYLLSYANDLYTKSGIEPGTYSVFSQGFDTGIKVSDNTKVTINYYTTTYKVGNDTSKTVVSLKGDKLTTPTAPTKQGYTFDGWYKGEIKWNFTTTDTVSETQTLEAKFKPNTNTKYVVKHCKQDLEGNYPESLITTSELTGTTDASITPPVETYEGFTAPTTQTVTIAADGTTVVTYKYTRNSYTLTWDAAKGTLTGGTSSGSTKFEAPITEPTAAREGYTHDGWDKLIPTTMPASDQKFTAKWSDITNPTITATLPTVPTTGWFTSDTTITLAYGDNEAVTKLYVKVDTGNYAEITGFSNATYAYNVSTEGTHSYIFKAEDAAGKTTETAAITVKLDKTVPTITKAISNNVAETSADIVLQVSESGDMYYVVNPTSVPSASDVVTNNNKVAIVASTDKTIPLTNLDKGSVQKVYLVTKDIAGNLSVVKEVKFATLQSAPVIDLAGLDVEYAKETITVPEGMEVYTDPDDPNGSKLTPDSNNMVAFTPGTIIYIRYPEKGTGDDKIPAGTPTEITMPSRPVAPSTNTPTIEKDKVTIELSENQECVIVKKGETPTWDNPNTDGKFTGLDKNTEYDIYIRDKATNNSFSSDTSKVEVKTLVEITTPITTGTSESNTVITPTLSNDKTKVIYKGEYDKNSTPSIIIGGVTIAPTMTWDDKTGKGTWVYEYVIKPSDKTVSAEIKFNTRKITSLSTTDSSMFADNSSNTSNDEIKKWLETNQKVTGTFDNKTTDDVSAKVSYSTTDTFDIKGKVYTYKATMDSVEISLKMTVVSIDATFTQLVEKEFVVRPNSKYTYDELGLPETISIVYKGTGYTDKTESIKITWTNDIPTDFGKTISNHTFEGKLTLPNWANGTRDISIVVKIVNKLVLKDDQITVTMNGWTYGNTESTPSSSLAVTDTNGSYKYSYSSDNRLTWNTNLPKSNLGITPAGAYSVKMEYEGDNYKGEKIVDFTVGQRVITVKANDLSMTVGGTLPTLTISYSGFAGTDKKESLITADAVITCQGTGSSIGSYPITFASDATLNNTDGKNYSLIHVDGKLQVKDVEKNNGTDVEVVETPKPEETKKPVNTEKPTTELPKGEHVNNVEAKLVDGKIQVNQEDSKVETGKSTSTSNDIESTVLNVGKGAVIVTVSEQDGKRMARVDDTIAVANSVLSNEEKELVNDGEIIEIRIDVKDNTMNTPEDDKTVVQEGINAAQTDIPNLELGQYVEISLFIRVGNRDWNEINETDEPLMITINIPEEIRNRGTQFYVIRAHNGEYTVLEDMDDNPATITINTGLFSTYAITYQKNIEQISNAVVDTPADQGTQDSFCLIDWITGGRTGFNCSWCWMVIVALLLAILGFMGWRFSKKES